MAWECRGCCTVIDGYMFDFNHVAEAVNTRRSELLILEAPQGMVRLLERLAGFLEACLGVRVAVRLEPSFGACSASLDALDMFGGRAILVHIGHGEYVYPLCWRGSCSQGLPGGVYLVEAEYLGGDPEALSSKLLEALERHGWSRVAVGYSVQHRRLAAMIAGKLSSSGVVVRAASSVLGCYYYNLTKLRGAVDAYLVVAGGYFHALGLGLALGGSKPVLRVDPYTSSVDDIGGLVSKTLARRYWLMQQASRASSLGIIVGLLPGQYRPWIADYLSRLAEKRGIRHRVILARYLSREYLDNLSPGDYDAFVVTSCPRLAIEDLGDYYKPVLTPAEARIVLSGGITSQDYTFPW
ncbi:hypothetical protein CF15_02625 [Pyrodictium occultum]|uniref:2-(3-amino-3-carboxypropyl)histidine synthase n=1 Tax=Pyrodictium occultum TaxID=2309 RepID=A0A0V8RUI8_PYROC|nr:2-(3-amino-3-carboxypropyl)histidine synthase subunit 1/2 [Pyrodictium occultum]KSW11729.1 hypothetical protein CF15_02625 [Pyrodictium occultum]